MTATPGVARTGYITPLSALSRADLDVVGAKAAHLGELTQLGFPVPDGFVLTTRAFHRFLDANGLGLDATAEGVGGAPIPSDLVEALLSAVASFGDAPLAVRSSGMAEDLPGASYAGQYETVLDVRGADALAQAVRKCWSSAFSRRVAAYRAAQREDGVGDMAVLVQRLVHADAAGVAFTANPVTGNRKEVLVSAVRGLGERLVSGQATPDEWVVRDSSAVRVATAEDAITADEAGAIADLARRVEAHLGSPQDIEWAVTGGQIFLLQARPITALAEQDVEPVPVPANPPAGFWERESSHMPELLSPMFRSAVLPVHEAATKLTGAEFSLLLEGAEFREIGGWVYQRIVPLGGKERPAPLSWLMLLLIRLVPEMRRRLKGMVDVVRSDKVGSLVERWYSEWKPNCIARAAELREVDPTNLTDVALQEHLSCVLAFVHENLSPTSAAFDITRGRAAVIVLKCGISAE